MESKLISILSDLKLNQEIDVIKHGTLDPLDGFPDYYITYWCWDNARSGYYDNHHTKNFMGYQIVAFSTDTLFLDEMTKRIQEELEKHDFIIEDDWTDYDTSQKNQEAKILEGYFIKKKEE